MLALSWGDQGADTFSLLTYYVILVCQVLPSWAGRTWQAGSNMQALLQLPLGIDDSSQPRGLNQWIGSTLTW
jgi:hypothetical protein